jgi:hypothetical protein
MQTTEEPLLGGTANRGLVFRVGDTVRRPLRPTSAATHALLRHLERVGFDGAPRFLGIDEHGREVLTYIPGQAICRPYPAWALLDSALTSVAELMREYHQAVATFDPGDRDWPDWVVPTEFQNGLVSHNDPNLDNVIFRNQRAVALIDFDLSSPGSAVWDVACAARLWAPLRPDGDIADSRRGRALARFRTFVDAYGFSRTDRERVAEAVIHNHDWCYTLVRHGADTGHEGFTDYWLDAAARAERTRSWYVRNADLLRAALCG